MDASPPWLAALLNCAETAAPRAYVPFSEAPVGAALLLTDGHWIPGVRVESASFSLTLPALHNAFTTAVALQATARIVGVACSRPVRPEEATYLEGLSVPLTPTTDRVWHVHGRHGPEQIGDPLSPLLEAAPVDDAAGRALARRVAERAYVPASAFPVGAVLETTNGWVSGVNVEHPDWARILCAERNALGTARSYGLHPADRLYLTCLRDPHGSPCGACRQWLVEHAPQATVIMDRGDDSAVHQAAVPDLLPDSFNGRTMLNA
ncbi:cytidine deaminase [Salisaeta longa]|uniref:cytidine deaminase n=1 Tax=Salisaeta longa TaxID=503170 RepID=UPI0003FD35AA|nr:cytidine deaminase [Salisaeta longa]